MKITNEQIITACSQHPTMRQAAASLGIHPSSFIPRAKKLGCYRPNPGRKGLARPLSNIERTIPLDEILQGKHPTYQTHKLRLRLFKTGLKSKACELCGTSHWMGQPLSLICDHINGVNDDHRLENLRIVCPNCDSLLPTFCGRNKKKRGASGGTRTHTPEESGA
jgi:hypothetical protein